MEREFVNYELALRMKGLGFNEPCVAHYYNNVGIGIEFRLEPLNEAIAKTNISVYYELAPLYQQAFRWFREKHRLKHIWVMDELLDTGEYTYEEAELHCLKYCIEIVENK